MSDDTTPSGAAIVSGDRYYQCPSCDGVITVGIISVEHRGQELIPTSEARHSVTPEILPEYCRTAVHMAKAHYDQTIAEVALEVVRATEPKRKRWGRRGRR